MVSELRALIVDDSDLSRLIVAAAISPVMQVTEAENGLVAVRKFQDAVKTDVLFDIIFMDVIMPEMDGKEAVKMIREFEENQGLERIPIYMVSASEGLEGIEDLVNGLLRKPASRTLLNEIVQKHFDSVLLS